MSGLSSHITLIGTTVLHAFTHAYGALLVPLYLLMVRDLGLAGVRSASLIVTIYMIVYCLGSYASGVLADRFDRRWLLGIGLIGNSIAIIGMGLVREYEWLVALGMMAGLFGTLFHPAANALVPAHYPNRAGLAIGLLGIGSGFGFFIGPQYAGWRAATAEWSFGAVGDWQKPLIELGGLGVLCGVVFIATAREIRRKPLPLPLGERGGVSGLSAQEPSFADNAAAPTTPHPNPLPQGERGPERLPGRTLLVDDEPVAIGPGRVMAEDLTPEYEPHGRRRLTPALRRRVGWLSLVLGCRDFAGVASMTLSSLFLQKALGYDVQRAGFTLGAMMLMGIIANPLAVVISPGRRRLPVLSVILVLGGLVIATTPWWPAAWVLPVLSVFQMCQLGSYAVSDAAMMERVHPDVRGRVVGMFLMLAGTAASLSPLLMGAWVDAMGPRSSDPSAFALPYGVLGLMMVISALSTPIIARMKAE
jgi:MFS family permease